MVTPPIHQRRGTGMEFIVDRYIGKFRLEEGTLMINGNILYRKSFALKRFRCFPGVGADFSFKLYDIDPTHMA